MTPIRSMAASLLVETLGLVSLAISTAFLFLFGGSLCIRKNKIGVIVLASAAVDFLNLAGVAVLLWRRRHGYTEIRQSVLGFGIVFSCIAVVWALVSTILVSLESKKAVLVMALDGLLDNLVVAEYACWAVSALCLAWFLRRSILERRVFLTAVRRRNSAMIENAPSISTLAFGASDTAISCFVDDSNGTTSTHSFEDKFPTIQPRNHEKSSWVGSKLPDPGLSMTQKSTVPLIKTPIADLPFEQQQMLPTPAGHARVRRMSSRRRMSTPPSGMLETILDASPGQPLDRTHPTFSYELMSSSPTRGRSLSEASRESQHVLIPRTSQPRLRAPSPSTRPVISEALIHPLFRTDSQHPPPLATAGTTVIASAFGGQYISQRSLSTRGSSARASRASSPEYRPRSRSQGRMPGRPVSGSVGLGLLMGEGELQRSKSLGAVQGPSMLGRNRRDFQIRFDT